MRTSVLIWLPKMSSLLSICLSDLGVGGFVSLGIGLLQCYCWMVCGQPVAAVTTTDDDFILLFNFIDNCIPQPLDCALKQLFTLVQDSLTKSSKYQPERLARRKMRTRLSRLLPRNGSSEQVDTSMFQACIDLMWRNCSDKVKKQFHCVDSLWFSKYAHNPKAVLGWFLHHKVIEKRYILFPVCQWGHWVLLILCDLDVKYPSYRRKPRVFVLDSLLSGGTSRFLSEARRFMIDLYGAMQKTEIPSFEVYVPKVPQQRNSHDCGVFVLYFIRLLLGSGERTFREDTYSEVLNESWFSLDGISEFRDQVFSYSVPKPMDKSLFVAPGELRRGHRHGKNIAGFSSDAILILKESPSKRKSGVANVEEPSSTCTGSKESGSAQIEENKGGNGDFSGEKNEDKSIVGNSSKRLKVRGINKCKKVLELEKGKKINVKFFNSRVVNNGNFSRYIGKLVRSRSICPLNVHGWEDISEAQKENMWACVKDKFQCEDEDIEIHRGDVLKHMKSLWKNFRADLYRHHVKDKFLQDAVRSVPPGVDENDWKWLILEHFGGSQFQKNSIQNRKNRSKVTMPHRTGSKPFRDIIYDMGGKDGNPPPITTLFFETRKKDDKLVDQSAMKKYSVEAQKRSDEVPVGSKIEVWWPDDKRFYNGIVASFDPVSKKHRIEYDDGDVEVLLLKNEKWKLLKDDSKRGRGRETDIQRSHCPSKKTPNKKMKSSSDSVARRIKTETSMNWKGIPVSKSNGYGTGFIIKKGGNDVTRTTRSNTRASKLFGSSSVESFDF